MSKIIHCLETNNLKSKRNNFQKYGYLLYFFTRAFLISLFIIMAVIGSSVMLYLGDLFYNVKLGNFKSPIFGAYVIVSPSMVPTINVNDAIFVTRTNIADLEIGDVITFASRDQSYLGLTVTHRIVGKQLLSNGDFVFRTKGDNNSVEDSSLVKLDDIYGKVVLRIPKMGYVQKFLSTPIGFFSCILVPIFIVMILNSTKIILLVRESLKLKSIS